MASESSKRRLETLLGHLRARSTVDLALQPTSEHAESGCRYTVDGCLLTPEQRHFYEDHGYLVCRGLVREADLETYRERFLKLCRLEVKSTGLTMMRDVTAVKKGLKVRDETVVNKIQDYQYDPVLSQYFLLPEVLRYVECFTGPNIMAMHTMLINKPPDLGTKSSRHPLHQDLHYFPFRPADKIVCSWTAMQIKSTGSALVRLLLQLQKLGKVVDCHEVSMFSDILPNSSCSSMKLRAGIRSVVNLQTAGEHAHCGTGLEPGGFSYQPEELVSNGVYYYNYGWTDYSAPSLEAIMDMVKRISADGAITIVREKRPSSIQIRAQLELIRLFPSHLCSLWRLYPTPSISLSLPKYLERQASLLHGEDARRFRYIPKVLHAVRSRLRELKSSNFTSACMEEPPATGETNELGEWIHESEEVESRSSVAPPPVVAVGESVLPLQVCEGKVAQLEEEMNSASQWTELAQERDVTVLFTLLTNFLTRTSEPMVTISRAITHCSPVSLIQNLPSVS